MPQAVLLSRPMPRILVAWIGNTDLHASDGNRKVEVGVGPIAQAVEAQNYDEVVLISDHGAEQTTRFAQWLRTRGTVPVLTRAEPLSSPTAFGEIYEAAVRSVLDVLARQGTNCDLTFHLSPGTPAMAAVWIILAKTRFPAELIESSRDYGVRTAAVPFDISAEFIPTLLRKPDAELERLSAGLPPEAPEFDSVVHRCHSMRRLIARARRVAARSVPVLIEGESGTGKELLARAIHAASPRSAKPFVPINCGAIPTDLVEAQLFGHEKGAFTGAVRAQPGYFRSADGGTLFLDEVGELPLGAQVKLLRALQEGEVTAVGATSSVPVNVRLIAATNRDLIREVEQGRFRADLFYRLAVAILRIPPLRDRQGDVGLLIDRLLEQVNNESASEPGFHRKDLSPSARNLLLKHPWPGNVREMLNTLRRVAVWTSETVITPDEVREGLISNPQQGIGVLNMPLGEGLDIQETLAVVARNYLERALAEAQGNKSHAARLLGLPESPNAR